MSGRRDRLRPVLVDVVTLDAPPDATVCRRPRYRVTDVILEGDGASHGPSAGASWGLGTQLYTDDQRRLTAICLDWEGAVDALPSIGLRTRLERAGRPGAVFLRLLGTLSPRAFADGPDELLVVFAAPAPWEASIDRWRVVEVGVGVLVGVERRTSALEWVSVRPTTEGRSG
jgi:hypothetical protein